MAEGTGGATSFIFPVSLSNPSSQPVSVDWSTAAGTATAPDDFTAANGTLIIPAGGMLSSVTVTVTGDAAFESDESFSVNLANPSGATIADAQALATIVNDDLAAADVAVTKSGPASVIAGALITYVLTVTNAGPQSASNVVVTDALPFGTTFVSSQPSQGTCSGNTTVTCALGSLAAGATATITLVVNAPRTPATISNTASVSNTPESDPSPGNDVSSAAATAVAAAPTVPSVSFWGLLALAAALAAAGVRRLVR
jgi:uncharacterized repeat protein (TIGR01451 family)